MREMEGEKKVKTYLIKLTFEEPLLGTVPKNPEVYKKFIMKHAALNNEAVAQELETVESVEESGWTGFHQLDGKPIIYDYIVKGFFKDACGMLRRASKTESSKISAHKKIIDGLIFVFPRQIVLECPSDSDLLVIERPLRASTAKGERITLARSDAMPSGTIAQFEVRVLGDVTKKLLTEWLDYGALRGFGQWRNAGYGVFSYTMQG